MARRCDCESSTCHPKADCSNEGSVKTIHSTVCADCAAKMPAKYLAANDPHPDTDEHRAGCARCQLLYDSKLPDTELRLTGTLSHRELATILHGLRLIQCEGRIEGCAAGDCEHFDDTEPLTNEEIDALCERINLQAVSA
jgi:hypothetical protein